jgi:hypothetical protein
LSEWVRTIRSLVQGWIHKLKNCVNSPWLGIRSNMIYIQTRYCWKPCPQER